MTCVVGIALNGKIYMGADSCSSDVSEKYGRKDAKVFESHDMLLGYSGSWRFGNLFRFKFDPPAQRSDKEDFEFLVTDWVDALRTVCKSEGYTKIEDNEESFDGSALIGYKGKLYVLEGDWNIGEPNMDYAAIGSGSAVALGALYASVKASKSMTPKARIEAALEAASEYAVGVAPPFVFLSK